MLAVLVAAALAGCAGNRLDRSFDAGHFDEVVRLFEADPALLTDERALFHAGVAYAMPDSPAYDPVAALDAFHRLLLFHPRSAYRARVVPMQRLLAEVEYRSAREAEWRHRVERLDARLGEHERELEEIRDRLDTERSRAEALAAGVERLNRQVRDRDQRIEALQDELRALREIDLNRPLPSRSQLRQAPLPGSR